MHSILVRAIIVGIVNILAFSIFFFPVWFAGYEATLSLNARLIETTCTVTAHNITAYMCKRPCFSGVVTYRFIDPRDNATHFQAVTVDADDYSPGAATDYMILCYPINSTSTCFFDPRSIGSLQFAMDNPMGFFIAALVVAGLCAALDVAWALCELGCWVSRQWMKRQEKLSLTGKGV